NFFFIYLFPSNIVKGKTRKLRDIKVLRVQVKKAEQEEQTNASYQLTKNLFVILEVTFVQSALSTGDKARDALLTQDRLGHIYADSSISRLYLLTSYAKTLELLKTGKHEPTAHDTQCATKTLLVSSLFIHD